MYTLMCIKLMTTKNLLYKKINKIKLKNLKKENVQMFRNLDIERRTSVQSSLRSNHTVFFSLSLFAEQF